MQGVMTRCRPMSKIEKEKSSMFHTVKEKRRGCQKYIHRLLTSENEQISTTDCLTEGFSYFRKYYDHFPNSSEMST